MLTHFSLLGIFFSLLNASRAFGGRFFTHVRLFFRVLGGSGSDVWASRDNFEGPKLLFLVFCRPRRSAMRKNCACAKTTVFPVFLYGFDSLQALCTSHKTTQNHSQTLSNRASCKDCATSASWGGFWKGFVLSGASLDRLLFVLGRLLASLGTSSASVGHFLYALGCLLAALWNLTAAFRLLGPCQDSILKRCRTSQTKF